MKDKVYHFAAGLTIGIVTGLICLYVLELPQIQARGCGLGMALLAGAAKETFDTYRAYRAGTKIDLNSIPKIWDFFDFGATVVGGMISTIFI